ncbi:MAG TPA: 50S ribosomal protein L29 [Porphyromonadaceae bacterium]|nr:50S ribosomal protein L29 [Porphyromonadaceae bacterium]
MKAKEVRELSKEELKEHIKADTFNYEQEKIRHSVSPIADPSKITKMRKDIARMKTILSQKEAEENK